MYLGIVAILALVAGGFLLWLALHEPESESEATALHSAHDECGNEPSAQSSGDPIRSASPTSPPTAKFQGLPTATETVFAYPPEDKGDATEIATVTTGAVTALGGLGAAAAALISAKRSRAAHT
ncbi:hypothetical protein [Streptomyces europaeiscabiei]|uniref:hypothetical protein n=1 Tax=Streptomyces europaeiscabiei TaxID=146819 RepID=UPI0038F60A44